MSSDIVVTGVVIDCTEFIGVVAACAEFIGVVAAWAEFFEFDCTSYR